MYCLLLMTITNIVDWWHWDVECMWVQERENTCDTKRTNELERIPGVPIDNVNIYFDCARFSIALIVRQSKHCWLKCDIRILNARECRNRKTNMWMSDLHVISGIAVLRVSAGMGKRTLRGFHVIAVMTDWYNIIKPNN